MVVSTFTLGGNCTSTIEFKMAIRYKHNLLLLTEDTLPRAAHWTLKSVWDASASKSLGAHDALHHGHHYACVVQEEDNLNPAQLVVRARVMWQHYTCELATAKAFLVPHGNRYECEDGQAFLSQNRKKRVWTFMGPDKTTVIFRRPFMPEDVSLFSFHHQPLSMSTTVARLSLKMTGPPPYPDNIHGAHGQGRCYHEHAIVHAGINVRMFESYEGTLKITKQNALLYDGASGRMHITSEWKTVGSLETDPPRTVHTTVHGEFMDGVPHGKVVIWVARQDGMAYCYDGYVRFGQTTNDPTLPIVSHRCSPHAGKRNDERVIDHDAKMNGHKSTFARNVRKGHHHHDFDLDAHLQWVILDTRPKSAYMQ
jgi:hypothetical protein